MRLLTIIFSLILGIQLICGQSGNFSVLDIDYLQIKSDSLTQFDFEQQTKDKAIIIEFWETWCGPCIANMKHLQELKDKFPNSLEIICVSKGDLNKTRSFISKNNYDFHFIYDTLSLISTKFPHTQIPFSILINANGEVQAQTSPGYITEKTIEKLIKNESISIPEYVIPGNNEKKGDHIKEQNSLVSFNLTRHKMGEPTLTKSSSKRVPLQIVTGYTGEAFYDTTEVIRTYKLTGRNILKLYQYTFNNYPTSRFMFDNDDVNSKMPNHLYNVEFSASSFLGNSKRLLRRQLNSAFDVNYELINIDTLVLRISKIDTTSTLISYAADGNGVSTSSYENKGNVQFVLKATNCKLLNIARTIEDKLKIPVIYDNNINSNFDINIFIEEYNQETDVWLDHFKRNGIVLTKDTANIEFIKIIKGCP